jgi:hypothetical protein
MQWNIQSTETKHTSMHVHTHTHTILTRNSFPNSSLLWAWIILISPLPFSKLWLANLLVPLGLTYDTFYTTQSHTISNHFYPKNTERMFFQNTDVQLQGYLMSQTRTLSSEPFFVLLICSNPFWVFFYACFQNTLCIKYPSTFQEPAKCTAGTTNSALTGTLVIWYKFLAAHKKLELYIMSHHLLMITNMIFSLDEPNLTFVRLIYLRLLRWPSCCRFGYK